MVYEFYPHLPTCYEDYEDVCLPSHESIREKARKKRIDRYYDHWNKDAYTWIDRFLEDSVGKKFDSVYSKVCERFRKKKDFEFREMFKSRIDSCNMHKICRHYNRYYLDSDRIIRKYKSIKKNKCRKYVMEIDKSEDYYIIDKKKLFLEYPKIALYLRAKLGNSIYYVITTSEKLPKDLGKKVEECITKAIAEFGLDYISKYSALIRNKKYGGLSTTDFIKCYYDSVNKTYYEGSPEYSKHYYEERSAERKRMREYRKEKELIHAKMLRDSLIRANAEKWIRKNTRESN